MKFSIITVNLNNVSGLDKTIQSLNNQSFQDFEHIIIDGNSIDNSVEVIRKYNEQRRLLYWISEPDTGIYNAMNKGLKKATGEYCLFLNSGDYLYNNEVLKDAYNLEFKEDIVYGNILMSNGTQYDYSSEKEITFRYFLTCTLPHSCSFIKTSLFEKVGHFNEKLTIVSDWEFFLLAVCRYNVQLKKIPLLVTVFDLNGISSHKNNKSIIEQEKKQELFILFPRFLADYERLHDFENRVAIIKRNWVFRIILKCEKLLQRYYR